MKIGERALVLALAAGCADAETDTGLSSEPTVEPANEDGNIAFGDENNYAFSGTIDGPTLSLQPASDVGVDWAELHEDLQCHGLDPVADIDNVALVWFRYLDEVEVEAGISNNDLNQSEMSLYLSFEPGEATSFTLSQLLAFGATDPEVEQYFLPDSGAWMMLLTTGTTIAVGVRMLAFLEADASSSATSASVADGCAVLDYQVDLQNLTPLGVLADGPWLMDWSDLATTGQGNTLIDTQVSEILLAGYESLDLADLEADFLDIESLADVRYTLTNESGTSADLSGLVNDADGSAFTGFDAANLWLLALRCGNCPSPAPLALTVLVPQ